MRTADKCKCSHPIAQHFHEFSHISIMLSSNTDSDSTQELLEAAASPKRKCTDPGSSRKRVKSQYFS